MTAISTDGFDEKDVISVGDGRKLGFVTDLELDPCEGKITGIVVSTCGGFPFFREKDAILIPWCRIRKIGEDAILVDAEGCVCYPREHRKRKKHDSGCN